ncbi:MAG TPA: J domain-containing protein [Rectinemataceae bacterium]|nr:J domain-containing protein [Rectinemataceae bacterium]
MKTGLDSPIRRYRPLLEINAALLAGGLVGALGGLYGAIFGLLIGFMVDRVRASLSRPEKAPHPETEGEPTAEAARAEEARKTAREVLGLGPEAGSAEIRHAWRRISKECHPDSGSPTEEGLRRFREAREAYETLRVNRSPRG